ncbi:MAG: acyl carrier protein [Bacillota bacterium]|nr:acyl carrier protein [Bacillota bacterium]
MNQTQERIIEIFRETMDYPEEKEISLNATFKDMGIDSMDMVEVVFALETEFEIEIPDEDLKNFTTVAGAVDFIEGLID